MRTTITALAIFLALRTAKADDNDFVTHVTLTTYNAVKEQCDETPTITADGTRIDHKKVKNGKQRIVAISRDLLWAIPLGSVVEIEGHGRYEVRDTMNERFEHSMDILQHKGKENFIKYKIKVTLIRKGGKK